MLLNMRDNLIKQYDCVAHKSSAPLTGFANASICTLLIVESNEINDLMKIVKFKFFRLTAIGPLIGQSL